MLPPPSFTIEKLKKGKYKKTQRFNLAQAYFRDITSSKIELSLSSKSFKCINNLIFAAFVQFRFLEGLKVFLPKIGFS